MADLLPTRLRGVADRIAMHPVQIEDANTVREAAARLDQARQEVLEEVREGFKRPDQVAGFLRAGYKAALKDFEAVATLDPSGKEKCEHCGGAGFEPPAGYRCPKCEGSGRGATHR